MATDTTTTLLDPNFPQTPDQLAESERLKAEAAYSPFNADVSRYKDKASAGLSPYFSSLFDQLGTMEKTAQEQSAAKYDDLVRNLQDSYNRRGTFFTGEAVKAEGQAMGAQVQNAGAITADFASKRGAAATEMNQKTLEQAAALQKQAYDDYTTNRKAAVDSMVSAKVAEYLPKYANAVQQQLADANSPWLEIPLEDGVDYNTGTPSTTNTSTQPSLGRYLSPAEAKSGKYKGLTVTIPGSGIRFKSPSVEPK